MKKVGMILLAVLVAVMFAGVMTYAQHKHGDGDHAAMCGKDGCCKGDHDMCKDCAACKDGKCCKDGGSCACCKDGKCTKDCTCKSCSKDGKACCKKS